MGAALNPFHTTALIFVKVYAAYSPASSQKKDQIDGKGKNSSDFTAVDSIRSLQSTLNILKWKIN